MRDGDDMRLIYRTERTESRDVEKLLFRVLIGKIVLVQYGIARAEIAF